MTRSNLSACSRGVPRAYRCHRGIAVIEVMMSVILLVIGTPLAFPSYRDMVHKRQLSQNTELLSPSTETMQAISFTSGQPATVAPFRISGNDWCMGTMESQDLLF